MRLPLLVLTASLLLANAARATDLATFIADVENLTRRIETVDAAEARELAASLPDAWHIEPASTSTGTNANAATSASANGSPGDATHAALDVRADWIKSILFQASREPAQWETRRADLLKRLAAVQAEAVALRDADTRAATAGAASASSRPVSRATARAALREVLSRREFAHNDSRAWTDALRRQVDKWLDALIDRIGGGPMSAGSAGRLLAWAVAIIALAALTFSLLRMRRTRAAFQPLALETPRLSSREWAARAAAALREGDAREAIRCGYHAALFRLEEQGVWRVDDARTPREYLSLLPRQDARRVALADLTRDFELTWYGSQDADTHGLIERLEVFGCRVQPESTTASS